MEVQAQANPGQGRLWALALPYWNTLWIMAGLAVLGSVAGQLLGYRAVGFFFLCGVLILGLFYPLGPVLFAAAFSSLAWDYFFIPPRFTFTISTSEDALMIVAYFLTACSTGLLSSRIRRDQGILAERGRENELLKESGRLHQALLNSISHELRTPLTALLGSAAALRDGATASDPRRRDALLSEIQGAGERLNRVIENLLDMARLNAGVLTLKREWQDPAELAFMTLDRLKGPLSGHTLNLDLPEGLPLINVDYRLIEHALSNLLLNAAGYSPAGSEITVSAHARGGRLDFIVSDQGPGVPAESLPHLFEKFYRVPGSPAGGTGLGLYIAKSLMQAHGGDAFAISRPGRGAAFTLSLPPQIQPTAPTEAP